MGKRSTHREPSVERDQLFSAVDEDGTGDGPKAEDGAQHKHRKFKQNWRLNMLSEPKVLTNKYVTPEWTLVTGVSTAALHAECTERTENLAISGIRHLKDNKVMFMRLRGPNFGKRMDNYIDKSWNSIYNYYRKSLHDLQKRKAEHRKTRRMWSASAAERRGRKGKGKERYKGTKIGKKDSKYSDKSKETMMKEREQWCFERSKPKALVQPPPVDRGPICDLELVKQRQDEIATPKRVYRTASKETNYKDPTKVPPAALTYEATERILRIAQSPPHKLQKTEEIIPGSVKPAALTYNISERVTQLAIPKPTTIARESDLNEDAFIISPAALKYVATPRILDLAKPKEYSFR